MTPQQWQRVKSVLTEALERKREEQAAFLDRACSAEPWLRAQVEMLLSSGDRSSVRDPSAWLRRTAGVSIWHPTHVLTRGAPGVDSDASSPGHDARLPALLLPARTAAERCLPC
jgi:hypothetical protein